MSKSGFISEGGRNGLPLILIVEDDNDTRVMMKYLLNLWSYQVIEAVDGEEGLEMAEEFQPDFILMDYSLPKSDGLTTTKQIRELPQLAKTPIIFISAFTELSVRTSALAAGADDFLTKPLDFGELEKALKKHSKNSYSQQEKTLVGGAL
jgi:DNA-binding response OmpR family regulator